MASQDTWPARWGLWTGSDWQSSERLDQYLTIPCRVKRSRVIAMCAIGPWWWFGALKSRAFPHPGL